MEKIEEIIQKFDEHIKAAHRQISDTTQKISDVDEHVHSLVMRFKNNIDRLSIQESNVFEKELSLLLKQYKENCAEWIKAINSMVEGKEFINQFEKSVLIVVFGNVNVGKSSVGNMIAGTADPDSSKKTYEKDIELLRKFFGKPPLFYEYDLAGENKDCGAKKKEDSFFKEGYVETTASIQYFTREEGMTWTDSPGICSVNQINGDLAKRYVEFADLVIFITTSSSPGKNDEIEELKKLFGKRKPVLILINKSDKWDKDEVNGEIVKYLVAKSQEDREKQEEYVQKQFREEADEILSEIDAVSISTYLAMQALRENNIEKFRQSGFPRFYEKLGKIFEKNAVDLKMNAPRQRINSMIDEIILGGYVGSQSVMGICQYQQHLKTVKDNVEKVKKEVSKVAEKAIPAILNQSMAQITSLVQEQAYQVRRNGIETELGQDIDRIVTESTAKVLEQELREVLTDYNNDMTKQDAYHNGGEIRLNARKEHIERYVYDVKEVRRDPNGLIEHIEHFFFKKEFIESKVTKRKVTETFVNGDNSSEILEHIQQEIRGTIQGYVYGFVQNVQIQYFGQEEVLIEKILRMLNELKQKLKGEKI